MINIVTYTECHHVARSITAEVTSVEDSQPQDGVISAVACVVRFTCLYKQDQRTSILYLSHLAPVLNSSQTRDKSY
eukprot:5270435-Pleurochrysis_carterae.AAC.1